MNSLHERMMTVHEMRGKLEMQAGELASAKELLDTPCHVKKKTYICVLRLLATLKGLDTKLSANFESLAGLKADLQLREGEAISDEFLGCKAHCKLFPRKIRSCIDLEPCF